METAYNVLVNPLILGLPPLRVSLAATPTIYLVASATFIVSTMTAYGGITARRMR